MIGQHAKAVILLGLIGLVPQQVVGQDASITALDRHVESAGGASACWTRIYDAAHLRSHPDQKVSAMRFRITPNPGDEFAPFDFALEAEVDDEGLGFAAGPCRPEGKGMFCGVECDGGGVFLTLRDDGKVLLDLEQAGFINMAGGCGEDDGFALESGRDDKQFLLSSAGAAACSGIIPAASD